MFETLGPTPEAVALALQKRGIKGMPNTVGSLNPIVKFAVTQLKVDAMMVDIIKGSHLTITFRDWRTKNIALPQSVRDFLVSFNRGEYPELLISSV